MRSPRYTLRDGIRLNPEQVDLIRRRTSPFIERGMHLPLEHVLGEVYLQGMRDILQAQEECP